MGTAGEAGEGLRRLRLLAGYSIRELADAAGITFQKVARAERNGYATHATIEALAAVLGPRVRRALIVRPAPRVSGDVNPVRYVRESMGISRSELVRRIGCDPETGRPFVSPKVLARVENGQRVRPRNVKRIALALGLDVATVLGLDDDTEGEAA